MDAEAGPQLLIDLHCHSRELSACSSLSVEEIATGARAAGLDAVCLTEHDRIWPEAQIRTLSARCGVLLLRGIEVTTELGHALIFGLDEAPAGMFFAATLRQAVQRAGGLMVLAHPARAGQPAVFPARLRLLFDAVEGINGSDGAATNAVAQSLAVHTRLPPTGGSDCHAPAELGSAATQLERAVNSEQALVAELKRGMHRALDLREGWPGVGAA